MRLTDKAATVKVVDESSMDVKLTLVCRDCGRGYSGADRHGGHCMTCHYSFASQGGFDKHRTGKHSETRRCLTPDELEGKGWTCDEHGVWRQAPPANNPWAAS